jgi:hypothetical protein
MRIQSLKFLILFCFLFFMSTLLATGKVLAQGSELKIDNQAIVINQFAENQEGIFLPVSCAR